MTLTELHERLENLSGEIEKYKRKGTKASSLRIRKKLLELAKISPEIRKKLVESDRKNQIME